MGLIRWGISRVGGMLIRVGLSMVGGLIRVGVG